MELLYSSINKHLTLYSKKINIHSNTGLSPYIVGFYQNILQINNYFIDLICIPSPVLAKYLLVSFLLITKMFHFIRYIILNFFLIYLQKQFPA